MTLRVWHLISLASGFPHTFFFSLPARNIGLRFFGTLNATTHYDVLGVDHNASQKEIRAAFIRKSKEFHPDKNLSSQRQAHGEFVRVIEAYRVLRSGTLRTEYDVKINARLRENPSEPETIRKDRRDRSYPRHIVVDPFEFRDSNYSPKDDPVFTRRTDRPTVGTKGYYGGGILKNIGRVPNWVIFMLCVAFLLAACVLHIGTYNMAMTLRRIDTESTNARNAKLYDSVRSRVVFEKTPDAPTMDPIDWDALEANYRK